MVTPILYNLPESKGTGKTFAEVMGFFVPAYIVVSMIFVLFRFDLEPAITILAGFVAGIILKAIDIPNFFIRYFKRYRYIYDSSRQNTETYKFYVNLFKDPKYSIDIYRNVGYSNCFIHLGPSFLIFGIIYFLSFSNYIDVDINYGIKTSLGLVSIGFLSIFGAYKYREKMFGFIREELNNFSKLSEKKEGHIDDYFLPNDRYKEENTKKDIEKIEKSIKVLKDNPTLISKESVDGIIKEKNKKLEELKKSRLELQLSLYKEIFEMIEKIEENLSNIKFPSQLNSLNKKQSKIIRYVDEVNKFLKSINQQLDNNKFSSDDIPLIFRKLQKYKDGAKHLNEYVDFESYLNTIYSRISKVKKTIYKNKEGSLIKIEQEINQIKNWYINLDYEKDSNKFPDSYDIGVKKDNLQKFEKKLIKKF